MRESDTIHIKLERVSPFFERRRFPENLPQGGGCGDAIRYSGL